MHARGATGKSPGERLQSERAGQHTRDTGRSPGERLQSKCARIEARGAARKSLGAFAEQTRMRRHARRSPRERSRSKDTRGSTHAEPSGGRWGRVCRQSACGSTLAELPQDRQASVCKANTRVEAHKESHQEVAGRAFAEQTRARKHDGRAARRSQGERLQSRHAHQEVAGRAFAEQAHARKQTRRATTRSPGECSQRKRAWWHAKGAIGRSPGEH